MKELKDQLEAEQYFTVSLSIHFPSFVHACDSQICETQHSLHNIVNVAKNLKNLQLPE